MALPEPSDDGTCLITGASSGIGAELARGLASRGLGVTLVAPHVDAVPQLESLIELISGAYERVAPTRRKKL